MSNRQRKQKYNAPPARGNRHAGGNRGPLPVTQVEFIAGVLLEEAKQGEVACENDQLEVMIRAKFRVSLRWFSWEMSKAHSYRSVERKL